MQGQELANQAFGQQMNLAKTAPSLSGQESAGLTTLGGMEQNEAQRILDAQKNLASSTYYQPLNVAQQYGSGIMGLISGYPGRNVTETAPSPSGLQTALSAGATLAGLYKGGLFG